jgi:hypothetical protein
VSTPIFISLSSFSNILCYIHWQQQRPGTRTHLEQQQKVHNQPWPSQLVQVQFLTAFTTSSARPSTLAHVPPTGPRPSRPNIQLYNHTKSNPALARTCCAVVALLSIPWGFRFLSSLVLVVSYVSTSLFSCGLQDDILHRYFFLASYRLIARGRKQLNSSHAWRGGTFEERSVLRQLVSTPRLIAY